MFRPHSVFMCFVWISEQTAIISLYSINWLVCITETERVYCAVRTGPLYTASLAFSNSTFCTHSVFMCFVWIWEQTAIISLYSINWLVCITETECLLRGTDWIFKCNWGHSMIWKGLRLKYSGNNRADINLMCESNLKGKLPIKIGDTLNVKRIMTQTKMRTEWLRFLLKDTDTKWWLTKVRTILWMNNEGHEKVHGIRLENISMTLL